MYSRSRSCSWCCFPFRSAQHFFVIIVFRSSRSSRTFPCGHLRSQPSSFLFLSFWRFRHGRHHLEHSRSKHFPQHQPTYMYLSWALSKMSFLHVSAQLWAKGSIDTNSRASRATVTHKNGRLVPANKNVATARRRRMWQGAKEAAGDISTHNTCKYM